MNAFIRLIAYARPYRARLTSAMIAMIVYGAASAGIAALIQPILDRVLPKREELGLTIAAIVAVYLIKGVGAYVSSYLMTDVGQRVVRDIRNVLFTHILGQSAGFFFIADERQADVADHERCRSDSAGRLRDAGRPGA